ncbi:hypothetical protein L226DRAFT_150402 [Lentinus tigrinus ALCF2SS1-7]|uniref:uncharacterized protein n=1 Tax=Lentinus tigrinus ALCF2SS1-7 TaxID=1328758 RepID=UPI0011660109|nr:hypothetical protein L226DRAFT_150402 [Lentinus tigrinus ALCF2SS1-7]
MLAKNGSESPMLLTGSAAGLCHLLNTVLLLLLHTFSESALPEIAEQRCCKLDKRRPRVFPTTNLFGSHCRIRARTRCVVVCRPGRRTLIADI